MSDLHFTTSKLDEGILDAIRQFLTENQDREAPQKNSIHVGTSTLNVSFKYKEKMGNQEFKCSDCVKTVTHTEEKSKSLSDLTVKMVPSRIEG